MKKYFLMILPSVIIISLFYILKSNNSADNKKLNELKINNIILQNKNDSIFLVIQSLEKLKIQADLNIEKLRNQEKINIEKINSINLKLKNIKYKYEKASNHSDNFSSVDVQRYFSDSLR
jgi:hypothetical protein